EGVDSRLVPAVDDAVGLAAENLAQPVGDRLVGARQRGRGRRLLGGGLGRRRSRRWRRCGKGRCRGRRRGFRGWGRRGPDGLGGGGGGEGRGRDRDQALEVLLVGGDRMGRNGGSRG